MNHSESPKAGVGRRGLIAGLVSGLGVAVLALGARKAGARGKARKAVQGPILYRRGAEAERYLKTLD
jgi:hypothetical protein